MKTKFRNFKITKPTRHSNWCPAVSSCSDWEKGKRKKGVVVDEISLFLLEIKNRWCF